MRPDFVLFLDENVHNCKAILQVLDEAGVHYERHRDHFAPGTSDENWLTKVGEKHWALLTTDLRIRTRHLERAAVQMNKVAMFCFTAKVDGATTMANALRLALRKMQGLTETQAPAFIATVTKGGEVHLLDLL